MESVIKLALEAPFKLGVVEVARMQIEVIRMYGNSLVSELNHDFHSFTLGTSRKIKQRMFVQPQLSEDAIQASGCGFRHTSIVRQMKIFTRRRIGL
jgi:hypothetical protein